VYIYMCMYRNLSFHIYIYKWLIPCNMNLHIYIYTDRVWQYTYVFIYIYVIFNYPIILYNLLCIPYMYNSAANMEIGQLTGTLSRTDKELDRDSGQ
jgi:hypothetical protein